MYAFRVSNAQGSTLALNVQLREISETLSVQRFFSLSRQRFGLAAAMKHAAIVCRLIAPTNSTGGRQAVTSLIGNRGDRPVNLPKSNGERLGVGRSPILQHTDGDRFAELDR